MLLQITEPGVSQESKDPKRLTIGIDLGTTHSVAAIIMNGKPQALRLYKGQALVPSVLDSKAQVVDLQDGVISSSKRLMGRDVNDQVTHKFTNLCEKDGNLALKIGDKTLTPIECASAILRHIKTEAEKSLDCKIADAVITVPAHFDDAARQMTRDAASLAGLNILRLINEPTAAALAYGLESNAQGHYVVYDFGGGTFDVSILRLDQGVFQVIATGGDLDLGGDDIDLEILNHFAAQKTRENMNQAKLSKEALAERQSVEMVLDSVRFELDLETLNKIASPIIEKTIQLTQSVLKDAKLEINQIDGVILVGGSTRLHLVGNTLEKIFGDKLLFDIDPDQAVALGAAIQAQALVGNSNHLLLDVAPLSLGIETLGGVVEKIIWRNTPLPVSVSQEYTTQQDGQTGFDIHIVQGEREFAKDNRSLARFELKGLPALARGRLRVEIKFQLDVDGILTVSAYEKTTGISQVIEVKPSYGLSSETIESMLEDSLKNGSKDMEARLLSRIRQKSYDFLDELKRALEVDSFILLQEEMEKIGEMMAALEELLDVGDRSSISQLLKKLEAEADDFAQRRMAHYIREQKEHVAS